MKRTIFVAAFFIGVAPVAYAQEAPQVASGPKLDIYGHPPVYDEAEAAHIRAVMSGKYRAPAMTEDQIAQQADSCKRTIEAGKKAIAQDKRVAKISGYENKVLREQAAVAIVTCQDILAKQQTP